MNRPSIPAAHQVHEDDRPLVNGALIYGLAAWLGLVASAVFYAVAWFVV